MICAIIDLGSNTFHILIVEINSHKFNTLYRERVFTRLGDGGIDTLSTSSIQIGLETVDSFRKILDKYSPEKVMITGTAALRTASNKDLFILPAEQLFRHPITIIDGDKEADLIYRGVKLLSPMIERSIIMDIGGGSTEFIIVENGQKIWAQSFKLGVGVLHSLFHKTEPMPAKDMQDCKDYIKITIAPLLAQLSIPIHTLVGASGSFEVFESMSGIKTFDNKVNIIDIERARSLITKVIVADFDQRSDMDGLPPERVKLIVVGMILIEVILDLIKPTSLLVTPYALKEGLLAQMSETSQGWEN